MRRFRRFAPAAAVVTVALALLAAFGPSIGSTNVGRGGGAASATFLYVHASASACETSGANVCIGAYGAYVFASPDGVGLGSTSSQSIAPNSVVRVACQQPAEATSNKVGLLRIATGRFAGMYIPVSALEDPAVGPNVMPCTG